jgi:hypothetical protein
VGFRFRHGIFTAILAGIEIIIEAVVGARNKLTGVTPAPTLAPTQDLRICCSEECQGISSIRASFIPLFQCVPLQLVLLRYVTVLGSGK